MRGFVNNQRHLILKHIHHQIERMRQESNVIGNLFGELSENVRIRNDLIDDAEQTERAIRMSRKPELENDYDRRPLCTVVDEWRVSAESGFLKWEPLTYRKVAI